MSRKSPEVPYQLHTILPKSGQEVAPFVHNAMHTHSHPVRFGILSLLERYAGSLPFHALSPAMGHDQHTPSSLSKELATMAENNFLSHKSFRAQWQLTELGEGMMPAYRPYRAAVLPAMLEATLQNARKSLGHLYDRFLTETMDMDVEDGDTSKLLPKGDGYVRLVAMTMEAQSFPLEIGLMAEMSKVGDELTVKELNRRVNATSEGKIPVPTVYARVRELEKVYLVEQTDKGYQLTVGGKAAIAAFEDYQQALIPHAQKYWMRRMREEISGNEPVYREHPRGR